jgi:hypothetical protein
MKCFQLAFQFLNLYPKFVGTILHVNVDFHQLSFLLQIGIFQLQQSFNLLDCLFNFNIFGNQMLVLYL